MEDENDQIIIQIANMGEEYEGEAIEELYFRLLVKNAGTQIDRTITATRYGNGIRVTIETKNNCRGLFFTTINDEYEEEDMYTLVTCFLIFDVYNIHCIYNH